MNNILESTISFGLANTRPIELKPYDSERVLSLYKLFAPFGRFDPSGASNTVYAPTIFGLRLNQPSAGFAYTENVI